MVLLSIVFATATLLVLENTSGYIALEKMPFVASAVIIALIYAITEALGIVRQERYNTLIGKIGSTTGNNGVVFGYETIPKTEHIVLNRVNRFSSYRAKIF